MALRNSENCRFAFIVTPELNNSKKLEETGHRLRLLLELYFHYLFCTHIRTAESLNAVIKHKRQG